MDNLSKLLESKQKYLNIVDTYSIKDVVDKQKLRSLGKIKKIDIKRTAAWITTIFLSKDLKIPLYLSKGKSKF